MSTAKRKRRKSRELLLSSTRPQCLHSAKAFQALPSSVSRARIRTHHTLQKRLTAAVLHKDALTADTVRAELESVGGLKGYQDASLAGQSKERGGDTSGVLVQWLTPYLKKQSALKLLEVGALSMNNACARSKIFGGGAERIDLKSRHPGILEQDFMARPFPQNKDDSFDVVSLSLVLNFLGDPKGRGEMLARVRNFLRTGSDSKQQDCKFAVHRGHDTARRRWKDGGEEQEAFFPALFLVLPAPCVNNSRYLDEERLTGMMQTLGYRLSRRKMSPKLVYYLWKYDYFGMEEEQTEKQTVFGKEEIRKGKDRNNFAITLS